MSEPSLHQLERDVEAARARLANDLSTLRSPTTYAEFTDTLKGEALDMKDSLVDKAKSSVQSTIAEFVGDLKAKAAANPAAALAIGAGIAWRLLRKPPIATVLVGAGLLSLLRTNAVHRDYETDDVYLARAKLRLKEQASDFAGAVKDQAAAVGETVKDKASGLADAAKEQVQQWSGQAQSAAQQAATYAREQAGTMADQASHTIDDMRDAAGRVAARASASVGDMQRSAAARASQAVDDMRRSAGTTADAWSDTLQETGQNIRRTAREAVGDRDSRDKLLLGAAGVAVVAALSIAARRRASEQADAE